MLGTRLFLAVFAMGSVQPAVPSIYPTRPVADTVFTGGALARLTWRDDMKEPQLARTGRVTIELHGDSSRNQSYIATLAKNVEPITRSHTVAVPLGLPPNALYHLRFVCANPPLIIYSADFKITQSVFLPAAAKIEGGSSGAGQRTAAPLATSAGAYADAATTVHAGPLDGSKDGTDRHNAGNDAKKTSSADVKVSGLVWLWLVPALIGLSLAV